MLCVACDVCIFTVYRGRNSVLLKLLMRKRIETVVTATTKDMVVFNARNYDSRLSFKALATMHAQGRSLLLNKGPERAIKVRATSCAS